MNDNNFSLEMSHIRFRIHIKIKGGILFRIRKSVVHHAAKISHYCSVQKKVPFFLYNVHIIISISAHHQPHAMMGIGTLPKLSGVSRLYKITKTQNLFSVVDNWKAIIKIKLIFRIFTCWIQKCIITTVHFCIRIRDTLASKFWPSNSERPTWWSSRECHIRTVWSTWGSVDSWWQTRQLAPAGSVSWSSGL